MGPDYTLIGERLKKARLKKGYTQEKLAELLNVSIAYLSRIETGKAQINLKRLSEVCGLLEVTEGYILNGASSNSDSYLNNEIGTILKDCSAEKKDMIYKVAKIISEKK